MAEISWTDKTWNPLVGCSKKSTGCSSCYAIQQAYRNEAIGKTMASPGRLAYYEGLTEKRGNRIEWTGKVNFVPEALDIPLKRKKPTKWFVNSMSDLFHESVPDEWIDKIFAVMALTPQHTYQVLTKRPERMRAYMDWCERRHNSEGKPISHCRVDAVESVCRERENYPHYDIPEWPLPNAWLGVSVEDQKAADERIPQLDLTTAALRFLSCEPLLGPLNLTQHLTHTKWVIVGGESGSNARPCELTWIESIVEQCRAAGVACWVKQLGTNCRGWSSSGKGDNPEHWPASIQVQQFPEVE
jgi:protein gp37